MMLRLFAFGFLSLGLISCSGNKLKQEVDRDMSQIRNMQAEHTATIESLSSEIRRLSGRLDEIQHHSRGRTAELEKTLERVSSRVPPPSTVPADLLGKDENMISAQAGEAAKQYTLALRKLRGADFRGAASLFKKFVEENPETAFSDNALFWLGVCSESSGNLGGAVSYYNDAFTKFPAEDFVQPALYHLGKVFQKMGSKQESMDVFQKLSEDFPQGSYASRARAEIDSLRSGR